MTQSLQDILKGRVPEQPPEIAIIKQFVREEFNATCEVTVQPQHIVVQVRSSALAGVLRPHLRALQVACRTDKRLVIRIS